MSDIISWDKAIGKKVKSSDDKDLGKVESITLDYIQTKEGMVSKTYYFIPKYHLSGYDGDNLWVSLTKDEVKAKFERENAPDHPNGRRKNIKSAGQILRNSTQTLPQTSQHTSLLQTWFSCHGIRSSARR